MEELKLGALAPVHDCRTLQIAEVLKLDLPPIPEFFTADELVGNAIPNPMYANDKIGDCVIASQAHWMRRSNYPDHGELLPITESEVKREYYFQCGWTGMCFDSVSKYAGRGLVMLPSLKKLRTDGWVAGKAIRRIHAFGSVNWNDYQLLKACMYLFLGCYTAVGLPKSASKQRGDKKIWSISDTDNAVASWGYHCMDLNGIVKDGNTPLLEWITWGSKQYSTVEWGLKYLVEAYALVDDKENPNSPVDMERLEAYLESVK